MSVGCDKKTVVCDSVDCFFYLLFLSNLVFMSKRSSYLFFVLFSAFDLFKY